MLQLAAPGGRGSCWCCFPPHCTQPDRRAAPPAQVNLVKVPSYGRDATKGLATALSMSFSMPPNLVLFLWMMLTKCAQGRAQRPPHLPLPAVPGF